jgi:hypothetical protein
MSEFDDQFQARATNRYGRAIPTETRAPGRTTLTSRMAPSARSIARAMLAEMNTAGAPAPAHEGLVARAAESNGHALPDALRGRFEASLGADLGGVRVHTDGAAAEAAASLSARAYAVGQDVFMGAGQYAPDTAFGAHLLAHEVAHTVQQRDASAGPQLKLEISAPGDAMEVEADAAADAMIGGATARVSPMSGGVARMIQREARVELTDTHEILDEGTDDVGGVAGAGTLRDHSGHALNAGEVGYSDLLLDTIDVNGRDTAMMPAVVGMGVARVEPPLAAIDGAISAIQMQRAALENGHSQESILTTSAVGEETYRGNVHYLTHQTEVFTQDRGDVAARFQSFNDWAIRANDWVESYARLNGLATSLGIHNFATMTTRVTEQLADASGVAGAARDAQAQGRWAGDLTPPDVDTSVTQALTNLNLSASGLTTAFTNFQSVVGAHQLANQAQAEGAPARERVASIEATKAAFHAVGSVIDETMAGIKDAPKHIASAVDAISAETANLRGSANRTRMIREGESAELTTESHAVTNDDGETEFRNARTGESMNLTTGEESAHHGGGGGGLPTLPFSAAGILDVGVSLYYQRELGQLNAALHALDDRISAAAQDGAMRQELHAVRSLRDHVNAFLVAQVAVNRAMEERRRQYERYGAQLDAFNRYQAAQAAARAAHATAGQRHPTAPAALPEPGERFALVMTVTAQIRELLATGRAAVASAIALEIDRASMRVFVDALRDHRAGGREWRHVALTVGPGEASAYAAVSQQTGAFAQNVTSTGEQFAGFDQGAKHIMAGALAGHRDDSGSY